MLNADPVPWLLEESDPLVRRFALTDVLGEPRDAPGRWALESTFKGRFLVSIEQAGKPSKWVTLKAVTTLKRAAALRLL